jgi:signal transduction histidine kinase
MYGPASPPVYREYAGDIYAAGSHLLGIINDILDLVKTSAGKMKIHVTETDLGSLIRETDTLIRQSAAAAGVRLECSGAQAAPVVWADERKLKQVLINLLDNAIKFTPEGGSVTLESRQDMGAQTVEIVVSDTGIGIAEADIPTCLAPFGQADVSLARKNQGTGLGLPLSKQFIELMGGALTVESAVGKGTRVTVRLPLRAADQETPRLAA